tara:strand:- start:938 stop:1414 length:477 start_codon:yes stop_codon:yes gene_type:complete
MPWDENNVTKLRELWDQGLPTAQIGKLLGFTKNAVVGKAHRIGLERRPSPIRRTAVKPDRKKARSPVMPKLNFESKEENTPLKQENLSFLPVVKNLFIKSDKRGCEWPQGHPDEMDFHFCGKERFEDKPYCLDHCAIAYVVPEKEEGDKQQDQVNTKI